MSELEVGLVGGAVLLGQGFTPLSSELRLLSFSALKLGLNSEICQLELGNNLRRED